MSDFLCGALSGVSQTLIGHPFDTYKILVQNNSKNIFSVNPFRGIAYPFCSSIINCSLTFGINDTLKKHDVHPIISGFISGAAIVPVVYTSDNYKINEQLRNDKKITLTSLLKNKGKTASFFRESIAFSVYFYSFDKLRENNVNTFISGGISGLLNWTVTYPLDVIRNRQLAQNISFASAYKQGNLWKGYSFCAARSIKVNAVGFYVYEKAKDILK